MRRRKCTDTIGPFSLGSVFQRRDGRWVAKYRRTDAPAAAGWRQFLPIEARDEHAARDARARFLRALCAESSEGDALPSAPALAFSTFGAFVAAHHLPRVAERHPRSIEQHAIRWRLYCADALGPLRFSELTPMRLQAFLFELSRRPCALPPARLLSPRWVRSIWATVSGALTHAVALGLLPAHPGAPLARWLPADAPAAVHAHKPRALGPEDFGRLLGASHAVSLARRVEYAIAIAACLRPGEWRGLRWAAVRQAEPGAPAHLRILASYDGPTKTGDRIVPLHPAAAALLEAWRLHLGVRPGDGRPVFTGATGQMRSPSDHRLLLKSMRAAGVAEVSAHGLRHTGASLYLSAGVAPHVVGALLGHRWAGAIELGASSPIARGWSTGGSATTAHYARHALATAHAAIARVELGPIAALVAEVRGGPVKCVREVDAGDELGADGPGGGVLFLELGRARSG